MVGATGALNRLVKKVYQASLDAKALWGFKGDAFDKRVSPFFTQAMDDVLAACRSGNGILKRTDASALFLFGRKIRAVKTYISVGQVF